MKSENKPKMKNERIVEHEETKFRYVDLDV